MASKNKSVDTLMYVVKNIKGYNCIQRDETGMFPFAIGVGTLYRAKNGDDVAIDKIASKSAKHREWINSALRAISSDTLLSLMTAKDRKACGLVQSDAPKASNAKPIKSAAKRDTVPSNENSEILAELAAISRALVAISQKFC